MRDLIERLEKAQRPDRRLDADIREQAVGLRQYESICERGGDLCLRYYPGPEKTDYNVLPRYTASIDAAVTLIPAGSSLRIRLRYPSAAEINGNGFCDGSTAAIALCIAALKARIIVDPCLPAYEKKE